jgi:hypothetical protein
MSTTYTPAIDFPLYQAREYDEVVSEIASFFVSLAPEEVSSEATHSGYEPFYFGGLYPAVAAFEQGYEEFPKQVERSIQPGVIDIGVRFYLLSITTDEFGNDDASPRAGAQRDARRLHAAWRRRLYDRMEENSTMQGRVHAIQITGAESADMNRLGYAMAVDFDNPNNYLWVHHSDVRVYL